MDLSWIAKARLMGIAATVLGIALLLFAGQGSFLGWPPLLLGMFLWGGISFLTRRGTSQTIDVLSEANQKHGTNFQRENGFGVFASIFFDLEQHKILILTNEGYRVEDFSYIKSWQLKWTDVNKFSNTTHKTNLVAQDVHIDFVFNDYHNPLQTFRFVNLRQAEFWNARLNVLLGG